MANVLLDYSDITDIFKEKLKVDNIVKKISSIFLNPNSDYFIVMECSNMNKGYKHTKIILTLGGCI